MTLLTDAKVAPRLEIVEVEGHGRAFEVYECGEYAATYDGRTGRYVTDTAPYAHPTRTLGGDYAGRIAFVYGFDAYEAACAARIEADPDGWDCSDVVPRPFLVLVRPPVEVS